MIPKLLTGIKRSPTQIRAFIKRIGLRRLKVGFIPGKVVEEKNISEQENYREQKLEPLLKSASSGEKAVFFVDAAPACTSCIFRFLMVFY